MLVWRGPALSAVKGPSSAKQCCSGTAGLYQGTALAVPHAAQTRMHVAAASRDFSKNTHLRKL